MAMEIGTGLLVGTALRLLTIAMRVVPLVAHTRNATAQALPDERGFAEPPRHSRAPPEFAAPRSKAAGPAGSALSSPAAARWTSWTARRGCAEEAGQPVSLLNQGLLPTVTNMCSISDGQIFQLCS